MIKSGITRKSSKSRKGNIGSNSNSGNKTSNSSNAGKGSNSSKIIKMMKITGVLLLVLFLGGTLIACNESRAESVEISKEDAGEGAEENAGEESTASAVESQENEEVSDKGSEKTLDKESENWDDLTSTLHIRMMQNSDLREALHRALSFSAIKNAESQGSLAELRDQDRKDEESEAAEAAMEENTTASNSAAASKSQPAGSSDGESTPESSPEPNPDSKPESDPTPDPKPDPKPEPEPEPAPKPKPEPAPEPTPYSDLDREYSRMVKCDTVKQSIEEEVISKINAARQERGALPLKLSNQLTTMARIKSTDMSLHNYFSHTSPIYGSPFEMAKFFGIGLRSENIFRSSRAVSADRVHNTFMDSPGHRDNRMNKSFQEVGIGIVLTPRGLYVTELFR